MLARLALWYRSRAFSTVNGTPRNSHVVFLFPGQGSQYVGMCKHLLHLRSVRELFETARKVLGYDLLSICLNGPPDLLSRTEICQPAVMMASLAAVESLKCSRPKVFSAGQLGELGLAAGFSVGELSALVFAEAMSLEEGLRLVHVRAKAMQEATTNRPSGLVTVVGLTDDNVQKLCDDAKEWCVTRGLTNPVAVVSNSLFPQGCVVGGDLSAVQYIVKFGKSKHGAKRIQCLPVSGAFHTPLMCSAQPVFEAALKNADIQTPTMAVYSNVTCRPFSSTDQIKSLLVQQLVQPVCWPMLVLNMLGGKTIGQVYEAGPGKQLRAMLQRIDARLVQQFTNIEA